MAAGGMRIVGSVLLESRSADDWPIVAMKVERLPVRLVVRPVLRVQKVTTQPLFTEPTPGILITINPGRTGQILVGDLTEALLGSSGQESRLTFIKRWVNHEPKLLNYP